MNVFIVLWQKVFASCLKANDLNINSELMKLWRSHQWSCGADSWQTFLCKFFFHIDIANGMIYVYVHWIYVHVSNPTDYEIKANLLALQRWNFFIIWFWRIPISHSNETIYANNLKWLSEHQSPPSDREIWWSVIVRIWFRSSPNLYAWNFADCFELGQNELKPTGYRRRWSDFMRDYLFENM